MGGVHVLLCARLRCVCVCACMCMCARVFVCLIVCMYVCVCVLCVCVCVCVCANELSLLFKITYAQCNCSFLHACLLAHSPNSTKTFKQTTRRKKHSIETGLLCSALSISLSITWRRLFSQRSKTLSLRGTRVLRPLPHVSLACHLPTPPPLPFVFPPRVFRFR